MRMSFARTVKNNNWQNDMQSLHLLLATKTDSTFSDNGYIRFSSTSFRLFFSEIQFKVLIRMYEFCFSTARNSTELWPLEISAGVSIV